MVEKIEEEKPLSLILDQEESLLDEVLADMPAQYAGASGYPTKKWDDVTTTLKDLDTTKLHYVKVPENHIVIDFDIKNDNGEKDGTANLTAAAKWPATYAEYSKSGSGVHLHYIYSGSTDELSPIFAPDVEIKVYRGNSSLRRMRTASNNVPISTLSSGLPLKEKKMINIDAVQSEKGLRDLIDRNLRKEIHPGTKPSIDFIFKILEDAYDSGLKYDLTDIRPKVLAFANNSTHQNDYCVKLVLKMKFVGNDNAVVTPKNEKDDEIVFYDVEVFPNLFLVNWKYKGKDKAVVRMINPTPQEIEKLLQMKLVGFNCRRYDNHILYARFMGYTNEQLYKLSKKIIEGHSRDAMFGEAYGISYTDVYDFSSKKQSLKKFELEMGIHHQELGLDWNQPVPPELWPKVAEYCDNDVIATEAVFDLLHEDFLAREILANLSGLSVNDTTQQHTARIVFGKAKNAQGEFIYTDLGDELFPGYTFENGKSDYRGEDPGEGG